MSPSSDFSSLFDNFNLALFYTIDICAPSITIIYQTDSKYPWFNIEFLNPMQ